MRRFLILTAALCGFGSAVVHATPVTVTETGTVGYGSDIYNFFGVGTDLAGQAFTLTITNDPSTMGGNSSSTFTNQDYGGSDNGLAGGPGSVFLTINGRTDTFTASNARNESVYLGNFPNVSWANIWFDSTDSGAQMFVQNNFSGSVGNPSLDFNQTFSYNPTAADYQYAYFQDSSGVSFYTQAGAYGGPGSVTNMTWNGSPVSTPAPGALALLGLGLIGLRGLRRKAKTA